MGQIKFTVPDDVEERFRRQAMERFGHKRGSVGKAGEEALRQWAVQMEDVQVDAIVPTDPVDAIAGMLSDVDRDSVTLQESVGERRQQRYEAKHGRDEGRP